MADGEGFEPSVPFGTHAFQACPIDRSGTIRNEPTSLLSIAGACNPFVAVGALTRGTFSCSRNAFHQYCRSDGSSVNPIACCHASRASRVSPAKWKR